MAGSFTRWLALVFLGFALLAVVQGQSLPGCATRCLVAEAGPDTCSPTDRACTCTNAEYQAAVSKCVALNCTIPESLATKNATQTACGVTPRDRSQQYVVLSNVMAIVAACFVVMRFSFKLFISQSEIGYDDWCVLATLVAAAPSAAITVYGTVANGLGRDIWTLTPTQITLMLEYFYIMAWLYFLQVTLVKLSLLLFFVRIFPSKAVQRLLWGTIIFVVCFGVAFIVAAIFQCRPISYFWTKWDGFHLGTCSNINAISWSNAAISIALDFWILGIPLWQLWDLKLHWKKKVGVAMMFCVGTFVTVVSILRLQALVHFASTNNASWEFYDVSVWSTIEICVGIMCACLPTLRLLLVKLFPVLSGSSLRSRTPGYYHYGSGNELKEITDVRGSRTGGRHSHRPGVSASVSASQRRSGPMDAFQTSGGIMVKKEYTVQHSDGGADTDEASLVSRSSSRNRHQHHLRHP